MNAKLKQSNDYFAIKRIAKAIIAQAFIDMTRKYSRTEDLIAQSEAKEWLTTDSVHLRYICSIAELSTEMTMQKASKMLRLQEEIFGDF